MSHEDRIPDLPDNSRFTMERWFRQMYLAGLLYNPDDSADTIVIAGTGKNTFTPDECLKLDGMVARMFEHHGDMVYKVCMRYYRKTLGIEVEQSGL